MGKIFNALEKYKKERKAPTQTEKLKPGDYEVLLQYDWAAGKLDFKHPLVIQDPGTVKRLTTFRLIEVDGSLTPAGKAKYAELKGPETKSGFSQSVSEPEKETGLPGPSAVPELKEIEAAVSKVDVKVPSKSNVREKLTSADWDVLMKYDRATRKLDVKRQDADVVRRLLDNEMIFDHGNLTPHALQLCRELEPGKNGGNAEEQIRPEPLKNLEPVVSIVPKAEPEAKLATEPGEIPELVEAKEAAPEAAEAKEIEPELVKAEKKRPVVKTSAPKPSLPPSHSKRMDRNLVSLFNPQSFEAEQFKILRSNLLYPVSGNPPRSLMVTSPLPGEGKSFVASNLAISVALNINRHVLLMDCDLRRPTIHSRFGFDNVPGLSDYLLHGMGLQNLLVRTSVDNLTILPGGQPPDNPSELLSSERMSELLEEATERYHDRLIILDSPPPTMTAETSVLARWVDGVVIVVKHGKTPQEGLSDVINKIGREKIIGGIMNNYAVQSSRYYGKYYGKREVYKNKKKNA